MALEPRLGGRIFERTPDGTEIEWGRITSWQPPHRLGYAWHIGRDPADATDVEVTFVDLGDGTSRLDIVHSGWERLGAQATPYREANTDGWQALAGAFVAAAEAPSATSAQAGLVAGGGDGPAGGPHPARRPPGPTGRCPWR